MRSNSNWFFAVVGCLMVTFLLVGNVCGSIVRGSACKYGECDHSGIAVRCLTCDLPHDTLFTDATGWFGTWLAVSGGRYHDFEYTHPFFCAETLHYYIDPMATVVLPSVTLDRCLDGSLYGTLGPGDWPVVDEIWVDDGKSLDILPGARLLFTGQYEFNIYGLLEAIGESDNQIVFTADEPSSGTRWGGIRFYNADPACKLQHCRIEYGSAIYGGGIYCERSDPTIRFCTITNNEAEWYGGGLYCDGSSPVLENCTVVQNSAQEGCAIYAMSIHPPPWPGSYPVAVNTIIYYNDCIEPIVELGVALFEASYCDIEVYWPGPGNVDCDPLFEDTANGNYHLTWENYPIGDGTKSCCIDAGNPSSPNDPDGTQADIGAYPFYQSPAGACVYKYRCDNDMGLMLCEGCWSYWTEESTIGVYDGDGAEDLAWFMMDMYGLIWAFPPAKPQIYYFGLIAAYDQRTCDTVQAVRISGSWDENRGLAYDTRDGSFWYTVWSEGDLYHISGNGYLIASHYVGYNHITGLAFDADNNHLWAIINGAPDLFLEYDVTSGTPTAIQGPIVVPWSSSNDYGAAGLDYDEDYDRLLALNQNFNSIVAFRDLDPASSAGVAWQNECELVGEKPPSPWGIAVAGSLNDMFVADNTSGGPFPLDRYRALPTECTNHCGVDGDVWRLADSPHCVICDVTVPAESTLIIEPGVEVLFTGHYKLNVSGRLKAVGTEQDSIVFTIHPENIDSAWWGIRLNDAVSGCTLQYCRIEHGEASGSGYDGYGGGISCINSDPTVLNCNLRKNSARNRGGAIYCENSSPTIENSAVCENSVDGWEEGSGAGICCRGSHPTISDNIIQGNYAYGYYGSYGAGIHCNSCTASVSGNTITANSGAGPRWAFGAGIFLFQSLATVWDNTISGNYDTSYSRGYHSAGAGIYSHESELSLELCLISGNSSDNGAGVWYDDYSGDSLKQCTITGNRARGDGGGIWCDNCELNLENTILWANCAAGSGDEAYISSSSSVTFRCCDVDSSGIEGDGSVIWVQDNIFIDPLFCEPAPCDSAPTTAGDYHVFQISPCAPEQQPYCGLIGALDVGCEVSYPCEYVRRCLDDMYMIWPGYPECISEIYTIGVSDGAGFIPHVQPPVDNICFAMDTKCFAGQGYLPFGKIVFYDPDDCSMIWDIETPQQQFPRGLAHDERGAFLMGTFWYTTSGGGLHHIDEYGEQIDSYSVYPNITGLAMDHDNYHLWAIINGAPDLLVEYDVSSGNPVIIQGPFEVPWSSPDLSAAGLEYDDIRNMLLAIDKTNAHLVYFRDMDSDYHDSLGTPQPGVHLIDWCGLPLTPWGIALAESSETVFIANEPGRPYPLDEYISPCLPTGDVNADGVIDLGDVLFLISYLYKGGSAPDPLCVGDVNCDGVVDLGDVLYLICYLYKDCPPPCCY